ncbi:MAG: chemotaxis protein CheD [Methanolobus sp.]|jgi:chemotaxis protein CheD|uniref:Probable chemoreceptor glutamine deamidase CheD n=1 Tax=Methanolobus tindarius DSM 2278 TaxID=1090322 RepID=W9DPW3_METTI|nr:MULTISPECIES: chemotaxis protein CheD [Methanolobus]ETA67235.1 chemotaxis protein [Methanolobus tindarius DSM 2278]MDK2832367.1 chemotaxis protein CheD [Methanolobus sp.]MDK2939193.1 chemotaxis protein CheD [Methanolobus sp.]
MIIVGMADSAVAKKPAKLTTLGLGSCVGISLYDKSTGVGGMVHIMLPSIENARSKDNIDKFADTGIPALIDTMVEEGAYKHRTTAKIAGGASMFSFNSKTQLNIGERNVAATKDALKLLKIPIVAEDTGKNYGRTIVLDTENGELTVKSALKGIKVY